MKRALLIVVSIVCLGWSPATFAQSEDTPGDDDSATSLARHEQIQRDRDSQVGAARAQQRRLQALQREMSDRHKADKQEAKPADGVAVADKPQAPTKPRCVGACP